MASQARTRPVTKKDGANDPLRQVLSVGRNVLIRTVTNYFVGLVVSVDEKFKQKSSRGKAAAAR